MIISTYHHISLYRWLYAHCIMKYTTVGLSRCFYRSRRQRDGSACSACSARYLATVFAKLTSQDEAERVMDPAWESLESSAIGVIKKKRTLVVNAWLLRCLFCYIYIAIISSSLFVIITIIMIYYYHHLLIIILWWTMMTRQSWWYKF